jgi:hypothetical protein
MQYILTKKFDGTFTMSWIGFPVSTDEISTQIRDVKTFTITPVKSIKTITSFNDIIRGENEKHYFKKYFSYSNVRSGVSYSESLPISAITMDYCPLNLLYLNLSYYRIDTDTTTIPQLSINSIVIEGTYDIEETDEIIEVPDDGYILSPKDIYKVFKLTGFEIYGINTNNLIIKYRFTQDGGRTYTKWEDLTTENISTIKLNPIRFAQVQYSIQKINNSITSKIYDIILLGDFQNINNNYLKTNRYGVRQDCSNKYPQWSGDTSATIPGSGNNAVCLNSQTSYKGDGNVYNYNRDWFTQGLSCYLTGNVIANMSAQSNTPAANAGNYDPYAAAEKIGNWYNYLANSMGKILGWTVDYHLTDPDGNGIDRYLHEYQLFNIVDVQKLKIIVPENTFPDNQVQINEYALDMMDTFTVYILKDEFHKAFGIEKRPAQKDVIFFCQANRFYRVRHAQVHRDIMYMGIYYNVVLEKYEKLANEQNLSQASKNLIDPLTQNNTIDSLFGFDMREDENKVTNKQLKPTTHEYYFTSFNPKLTIIKKDIFNSLKGTKIADNYYNLSTLKPGVSAVTYSLKDPTLNVSENRSFNLWFNFNNKYDSNKAIDESVFQSYNIKNNTYFEFLNNFDSSTQKGYKIGYANKQIILGINNLNYYLDVTGITTNIWYGLNINIDNRQRKISIDLFKRNYNYNITMFTDKYKNVTLDSNNTTGITYYTMMGYRPVKNTEINETLTDTNLKNVASIEYNDVELNSFNIDKTITIYASDIKLTNIRIFNDVIPNVSKSNILIQRVIQDSNYLILADNATRELYTSNIQNTRWE